MILNYKLFKTKVYIVFWIVLFVEHIVFFV